jgi:hypothetical protein
MHIRAIATLTLLLLALAGCGSARLSRASPAPEQQAFFAELQRLCGQSFAGTVIEAPPTDTLFAGNPLVMRVEDCTVDQIVIPVQVGSDRSRTWIVSRSDAGLQLTHVHRRADGSEDENSRYGGMTRTPGTSWRQDFPADTFSIRMVPARATQTWTLELRPGQHFDYSLHRVATDLRYRFRFDLSPARP